MERLTERFDGCVMKKGCHGPCRTCHMAECADIYPMIDHLAAYEDTGLEPEDIVALQKREQGFVEMLVNVSCGCAVSYSRLAELAQAEKDGRLVVLPDAKYTDADGEKALRKAMWTCGNTNNPVTRYAADAIAEKLCRNAKDENPPLTLEELREMDGEPAWIRTKYDASKSFWAIVNTKGDQVESYARVELFEDYWSDWLAYRRKPEENT